VISFCCCVVVGGGCPRAPPHAAWTTPQPNVKPQLMTVKDFSSPTMTIMEKLAALTPSLEPLPCPLARLLGIPLTLYAYPEVGLGKRFV